MQSLVAREPCPRFASLPPFVIVSAIMQRLVAIAERAARSSLSILVTGETGSGKEVVARLIHEASGRSGQLVSVNCAGLAPTIADSELFGHVRGAFTGAECTRRGLCQEAARGTLFLDEVGELDTSVQAKLLRLLTNCEIRPVGANVTEPFTARVVAATNRDLRREVDAGRFRDDLYYRLAGIELRVPPLRERRSDIRPLAQQHLDAVVPPGRNVTVPEATWQWLEAQAWRGNVRELRQAVERAVVLSDGELRPDDFGVETTPIAALTAQSSGQRWDEIEREVIAQAIRQHGGVRQAAIALGRPKSTLYDRARQYGLTTGRAARLRHTGGAA